jgi:sulfide:quinone oxidoreductase
MNPAPSTAKQAFGVLVIGGGNAGIGTAARLLRKGVTDVAVLEPQDVHTYRPLLSYVGGGEASMRSAERTQRSVTPRGCSWLRDAAASVDADQRVVHGTSGRAYGYSELVLAPGLVPDDAALPGIAAALDTPHVTSNYLDTAEKTWALIRRMPAGGRAVFTVPRPPVSCTGTTIKPLFLAAAHWKRTGRLDSIDITLIVDRPTLSDAPDLHARLADELAALGVRVHYDTAVTRVLTDDGQVAVTDADGDEQLVPFEMLHLVPPFRGPDWVAASNLAGDNPVGLVDVDPRTLRHRSLPNVWAAGDGASIETDPSGGALRRQVAVLVDNLIAARTGETRSEYDGYTVAPITTDAHQLITGEFDRSGELASSLPSFLDPLKPRRTAWAFDRYGLPQVYWHYLLRGRV